MNYNPPWIKISCTKVANYIRGTADLVARNSILDFPVHGLSRLVICGERLVRCRIQHTRAEGAYCRPIVAGKKQRGRRQSHTFTYPTKAAEYWIRGSKELGATPIMFPEHPRKDNTWEGQTLWDLHSGIAVRENVCVAPVGPVWDEVIFRDSTLVLHQSDGNHASEAGLLLTALVFYQIITGQPVESLPELSGFGIDSATEQIMKESVSSLLFVYPPCAFEV